VKEIRWTIAPSQEVVKGGLAFKESIYQRFAFTPAERPLKLELEI